MIQQGLKFSLYEYLGNYIKSPFINGLTTGAIQGFLISHFEIKKLFLKFITNHLIRITHL